MRTIRTLVLMALLHIAPQLHAADAPSVVPGELYIRYRTSGVAKSAAVDGLLQSFGMLGDHPAFEIPEPPRAARVSALVRDRAAAVAAIRRITLPPGTDTAALARKLSALPEVEFAEPVPLFHTCALPNNPDDPAYRGGLQPYLSLVRAPEAWAISHGDTSVVIAIVDSGTDWTHPDLAANIWSNPGEIPGDGIDNDHNDKIDDVHGWDLYGEGSTPSSVVPDNDPIPTGQPHGTHVAGIAAGVTANGIGIASLSHNVRFIPIKTGPDASDEIYQGYQGVLYAASLGADIINCSWGGGSGGQAGADVMAYAAASGSLVICAAGNSDVSTPFYPAAYVDVLAVGAIDSQKKKSSYSNYGAYVDVMAPGNDIYSTTLDDGFLMASGTSSAAPVVSALAALITSAHPEWTSDRIRAQIVGTAAPLDPTSEYLNLCGSGYIDAAAALGPPVMHLEVIAASFADSVGIRDGLYLPGEHIQGTFTIKNFGEPATGVTVTLSSLTGALSPATPTWQLGTLASGDTVTIGPMLFTVNSTSSQDTNDLVRFDFVSSTGSASLALVEVGVNPSYATVAKNSIMLSMNDRGNIGFGDYSANTKGAGFVIDPAQGENEAFGRPLLFEGGFMIGAPGGRVSDAVRGTSELLQDSDFTALQPVQIVENTATSQVIRARLSDASTGGYGVTVTMDVRAENETSLNQCILLDCTIRNESASIITNLRAGFFLDFDIPDTAPSNDSAFYHDGDDILVMTENQNIAEDRLMVGVALADSFGSPWMIRNASTPPEADFGLYDGFTDAEKRQALFGGKIGKAELLGMDVSLVAASTSFTLAPGEMTRKIFILAYGLGYTDLRAQITAGRNRAADLALFVEDDTGDDAPESFALNGIYPNPFNPATTIRFTLPEAGEPDIAIYALTGQLIRRIEPGVLTQGTHQVIWDGCDDEGQPAASGVYIARLRLGENSAIRRMTLLR